MTMATKILKKKMQLCAFESLYGGALIAMYVCECMAYDDGDTKVKNAHVINSVYLFEKRFGRIIVSVHACEQSSRFIQ